MAEHPSLFRPPMTVWKFTLTPPDDRSRVFLGLPEGAETISAGTQEDALVVWALVPDPKAKIVTFRFLVANTGDIIPNFPPGARFLATVTVSNGIVWHIWDAQ